MKIKDLGSSVNVTVSSQEVSEFSHKFPGSNLPNKSITFIFDKKSGNIEEIFPRNIDGEDASALAQDAWEFYSKNKPSVQDRKGSDFRKEQQERLKDKLIKKMLSA